MAILIKNFKGISWDFGWYFTKFCQWPSCLLLQFICCYEYLKKKNNLIDFPKDLDLPNALKISEILTL